MRYELLKDSCEGVLIDSTPILRDIADTFEVSFLLPDAGSYIALFKGEDDIEHKALIKNGTVKIPKPLLNKEQLVRLTVCKIDGDKIVRAWECWSLRIGAFLHMRQRQWQVAAAEKDIIARLAELERESSTLKASTASTANKTAELVTKLRQDINSQTAALASLKTDNGKMATAYNSAIEVINDLSKRVAAVEKHYDPTLIK